MRRVFVLLAVACLLIAQLAVVGAAAAAGPSSGTTRTITRAATVSFDPNPSRPAVAGAESPEFATAEGESAANSGRPPHSKHRPNAGASGPVTTGKALASSNPQLVRSFNGINHRDHRTANGGNQFSVEPPDQGLCVGNGYVFEAVNDAAAVYNTSGTRIGGVTDLNTFYGYAPAIVRPTATTPAAFGPFITDPSCLYDPVTQRWFVVVLTLDTDPASGAFLGPNHLDIAVSTTNNPTGAWSVYRLPVQDDGSAGTPDHDCSDPDAASGQGPCIGDYPHIGADTYGFYVSTNEYAFFGPEFIGAQVYAFSKTALASNATTLTVTQFNTAGMDAGNPGFTVWPAISPSGTGSSAAGGTEFFLSSNAAEEANGTGSSTQLLQWRLTNTSSLATATRALTLSHRTIAVKRYATPPAAVQRAGSIPLADCLNNNPCATFLIGEKDKYKERLYSLDSSDTRMQQVYYANGRLWAGLDTSVTVNGKRLAGIEYFVINAAPGTVKANGYVALAGQNLTYPAVATLANGRGVMAFTVVGPNHYPSAGYAVITASGVGAVHVAAAGAGPADGFSGYRYFGNPPGTTRPRWGDYGAAAVQGNSIWIASEYIAQTCTFAQYKGTPATFGSCGGTRTALANWATRISRVTP
jgi:hypothetical protein